MKKYSIAAIIWEDHTAASRATLTRNPDEFVTLVLSVGIIIKETEKVLVLVSEIERYDERDDVSYIVIIKSAIVSREVYGTISINKPR